jgi:hypothetical protein
VAVVTAAVVGCVVAAGVATALGQKHRLKSVSQAVEAPLLQAQELSAFSGTCGTIEVETDYVLSAADQEVFGMSLDHIPSPDMCCAMCQGVPECKSWGWVKDAGLDGCPSQCWLKGGLPIEKKGAQGVTSGVPPSRPSVQEVPATPEGGKELFCFSLMMPPPSYEVELIQYQFQEGVSIFACDAYAVYSNVSVEVGSGLTATAVPGLELDVKFGGDSYTALNTWIFIGVWKKVIDEGWHNGYDWVVKADPDAVFFPGRLRPIVQRNAGQGYINNCQYGLHGPLEVLSASALKVLEEDYASSFDGKAPKKCVEGLEFGEWGEDFFFSQCMWKIHGLTRPLETDLLCEAHCSCPDWFFCANGTNRVSYHPFKRVDMYTQCMANAQATGSAI